DVKVCRRVQGTGIVSRHGFLDVRVQRLQAVFTPVIHELPASQSAVVSTEVGAMTRAARIVVRSASALRLIFRKHAVPYGFAAFCLRARRLTACRKYKDSHCSCY